MLFKKYGSVAGSNFFTKYKGKSNGRLNSYNFNKFVRKPFADKAFHNALVRGVPSHSYTAFDSRKLQKVKGAASRKNLDRLPAFNVWRNQLKENQVSRKSMLEYTSTKPLFLGASATGRQKLK